MPKSVRTLGFLHIFPSPLLPNIRHHIQFKRAHENVSHTRAACQKKNIQRVAESATETRFRRRKSTVCCGSILLFNTHMRIYINIYVDILAITDERRGRWLFACTYYLCASRRNRGGARRWNRRSTAVFHALISPEK